MQRTPVAPSRPLWKSLRAFLGPLVLTNMLQALSGTLNNSYTGQLLGIGALAAVAAFFPLLMSAAVPAASDLLLRCLEKEAAAPTDLKHSQADGRHSHRNR